MKQENGFTLIELLAAMVAGSFLLVSLSWSVSSLTRQLPVPPETVQLRQIEALAPALSGMLERIRPSTPQQPSFAGDAAHMSAIVPPPMAMAGAGPLRLSLNVRASGEGQALHMSLAPIEGGAARESVLAEGFRKIQFSYAGAEPPSAPRLITIAFTGGNGVTRHISARPRLDSDGRCRFDPISMTCRS
jgi:prepilin-type N-terminal cleavage/methylation domain-containing protein